MAPARKLLDDYLHMGSRRRLVQTLRGRGITHERVLLAMSQVPRHWFVAPTQEALAYEDRALPIGRGQTISQPYTVAYQSALLDPSPRSKVLEIGTGSGYQAAVLAALGARVYTLERQSYLYERTQRLFHRAKLGPIRCFLRDGHEGLPVYSPFDRILVTAGAEEVPQRLLEQLAVGGRLVIPVGTKQQVMLRITRVSSEEFHTEQFAKFRFVPFREGLDHGSKSSRQASAARPATGRPTSGDR